MLTVQRELTAHRTPRHVAILLLLGLLALASTRVTVPFIDDGSAVLGRESVAYGYFYLPVLSAPVLAGWIRDPFAALMPRGIARVGQAAALWSAGTITLATLLCGVVGAGAGSWETARLSLENGLWCAALVSIVSTLIGTETAMVLPAVYGALGLFLPSSSLFVVNRTASGQDLLGGIVAAILAAALARSRAGAPTWSPGPRGTV